MIHFSLFSGIGGFELAAHQMGWKNYLSCEINEFGNRVREYYWPDAYHHKNIKDLNYETIHAELSKRFGSEWRSEDIILTGGFPCQDASIAKSRGEGQQGLRGERTGLATEMLRAIEEIRPEYVIAENVANFLKVNNGEDAWWVLSELARLGYNAEWRICYAAENGAPHKRARLYIVAYSGSIGLEKNKSFFSSIYKEASPFKWQPSGATVQINTGGAWKSHTPILCLDDEFSGRLDGITFPKWRNESIKAYGNAVVPALVLEIFKAIEKYNVNKQ